MVLGLVWTSIVAWNAVFAVDLPSFACLAKFSLPDVSLLWFVAYVPLGKAANNVRSCTVSLPSSTMH